MTSHRFSPLARRGASAIEMAFVAPLILLLFFAGIEFSRANMVLNAADFAALEGARLGILPGADSAECEAAARTELDLLGIKNHAVNVEPANILLTTPEVTVTVSIPFDDNLLPMSKYFVGKLLTRSITLRRENDNESGS